MRYGFGEFIYDPMRMLLLRNGIELDVPQRVYACLGYLIENRERVVKRDELILKVWNRDNVSDHQMAQVIRAARQVLGDDGNSQCMIRTVMGVGYHWVAEVIERAGQGPAGIQAADDPIARQPPHADEAAAAAIAQPASHSPAVPAAQETLVLADNAAAFRRVARTIDAGAPSLASPRGSVPRFKVQPVTAVAAAVLLAVLTTWQGLARLPQDLPSTPASSVPSTASDPLQPLEQALVHGQFETVRAGLLQLDDAVAESAAAQLLGIDLDIERGRWQPAARKLAIQQLRARDAADLSWQARLLTLESKLQLRSGAPKSRAITTARAAITLLQSMPESAAPALLAGAQRRLASALMANGQLDEAALNFVQARDAYLTLGEQRLATQASCGLARVWMRQGRLAEALEQIEANAATYAQLSDPVSELLARNTALRIQVELLRFPEALASSDRGMKLLELAPDSEHRFRTLRLRAMVLTALGRLREAESTLEEAAAKRLSNLEPEDERLIPALHQLASQDYQRALVSANAAFATITGDAHMSLFDGRDGALLLWVMAAQGLADQGQVLSLPSEAQRELLQQPKSTLARIAQGRWLWADGQTQAARSALRQAVSEARQHHRPLQMLLASNALMDFLRHSGDPAAAERVLAELRTHDPVRIDEVRNVWADKQFAPRLLAGAN
ncbi:MAG: winged helix-turn-helix domain-containing protein [Rhodanobacteraceae bacterium]|nr:winged helix-turn-helix domain-containing protein [Rhodanobacteraceae bacterium]